MGNIWTKMIWSNMDIKWRMRKKWSILMLMKLVIKEIKAIKVRMLVKRDMSKEKKPWRKKGKKNRKRVNYKLFYAFICKYCKIYIKS
jgi:hypothetical protein